MGAGRLPGGWSLCAEPYEAGRVRGTRFARLDDGHPIPLDVAIGIEVETGALNAVLVPSGTDFGRTLLSFEARLEPEDLALDRLTAHSFTEASVVSGPDFIGARTSEGAARLSRQVSARASAMSPSGLSVAAGFAAAQLVAVAAERWVARVESTRHGARVYPTQLVERALDAADRAVDDLRALGGSGAFVGFCAIAVDGSSVRMSGESDDVAACVAPTLREAIARLDLVEGGADARVAPVLVTRRGATVLDGARSRPLPRPGESLGPTPRR